MASAQKLYDSMSEQKRAQLRSLLFAKMDELQIANASEDGDLLHKLCVYRVEEALSKQSQSQINQGVCLLNDPLLNDIVDQVGVEQLPELEAGSQNVGLLASSKSTCLSEDENFSDEDRIVRTFSIPMPRDISNFSVD